MSQPITIHVVRSHPLKALVIRTFLSEDKSGTRTAWRKLREALPSDDTRWIDPDFAYVFIPQSQWASKVDTLWVGQAVREFGDVPQGIETLDVVESLCASVRVNGDETHMHQAYKELFKWLEESEEYELDTRPGILGMEINRLKPVNPFTIPYEEVTAFNYEMLYPIRKRQD